jgi:hypothetical protein
MKPKKKNQLAENPNIWGTSYVKIPRKVLDMSLSQRASERNRGKLLILLYSQVYFKDGFVQNRNTCYICKRGYCIVNASKLADMAEIQIHAVRRYLRELQRAGYIEMSRNVYATYSHTKSRRGTSPKSIAQRDSTRRGGTPQRQTF